MLTDQEMLRYIYRGAEMGCNGINGIMPYVADYDFQRVLEEQRKEYQIICQEAVKLLHQKGGEMQGNNLVAKMFTRVSAEVRAVTDASSSHLAEMMIEGNHMGVTKMQKHLNHYHAGDAQVKALAEKQMKTAQDNMEQMKAFL